MSFDSYIPHPSDLLRHDSPSNEGVAWWKWLLVGLAFAVAIAFFVWLLWPKAPAIASHAVKTVAEMNPLGWV